MADKYFIVEYGEWRNRGSWHETYIVKALDDEDAMKKLAHYLSLTDYNSGTGYGYYIKVYKEVIDTVTWLYESD